MATSPSRLVRSVTSGNIAQKQRAVSNSRTENESNRCNKCPRGEDVHSKDIDLFITSKRAIVHKTGAIRRLSDKSGCSIVGTFLEGRGAE